MGERKILIPVDGSKPSENAFRWYLDNMRREKDLVIVMHTPEYDVSVGLPGFAADVDAITKGMKKENDRIENMLGKYMEELKKESIQGQMLIVRVQKPGEGIIETAEKEKVSNIIMGSRGLGMIRRTLMGSVSDYVAKHAPGNCAITILRDS